MMKNAPKIVGSPPPMRGKVKFFHFFFLRDRITPAYAGKSVVDYRFFADG